MKFASRLFPVLLALVCLGMAKKPSVSVRFHAEANARDGEAFSKPIMLQNPPREAFIEKVPSLNERSIKAMYPFQATDGSWGACFKLDNKGRIDLEVLSTSRTGSAMVIFVVTPKGIHQVIDVLIDRKIRDGVITIPRGMTELEITALKKEYGALTAEGFASLMKADPAMGQERR